MASQTAKTRRLTDNEMLDQLLDVSFVRVKEQLEKKAKLGDMLKIMETRKKIQVEGSATSDFWKMMERIRVEALGGRPAAQKKAKPGKSAAREKGKQ